MAQTVNTRLVDTVSKNVNGQSVNYRVSFGDVINAGFSENVNGDVQLVNHEGLSSNSDSLGFFPDNTSPAGDVVINHSFADYDALKPGQIGFWLHLHELGHAIGGLEDVGGTSESGTYLDRQKYTMMSYRPYVKFDHNNNDAVVLGTEIYASGLQLLDIAALQDAYGTTNTDTRSGDTTYALGQGLGFSGAFATDAFLYTIWDGGGNDTIDASGFDSLSSIGVEIDLREGRFSSIGVDSFGNRWNFDEQESSVDPDPGNVAIAYGTEIENATGTDDDDRLIGNDLDNILNGRGGSDTFEGNGGSDTFNGDGGNDTFILNSITSVEDYSYIDGGADTDTFGYAIGTNLEIDSTTVKTEFSEAINVEKIRLSGAGVFSNAVYVQDLGQDFEFESTVVESPWIDYTAINESLTFNLNSTTNWTVTGASANDDFDVTGITATPKFIGTNDGDTWTLGSSITKIWLGTGDDTVTAGTNITDYYYSGGTDVINGSNHLGSIRFDSTISDADISFAETNKGTEIDYGAHTQLECLRGFALVL